MTNLGTKIFIKLFCQQVGKDEFGNCYFQTKKSDSTGKHKRLVIYNGIEDASKIPSLWHSWLHYTVDEVPQNQVHYFWEKPHVPNLTGTDLAYFPDGSSKTYIVNKKSSGYYQAWKPTN